jgi:hypothetical protein
MDPLLRKSRRMMKRKNGHSWPYSHNWLCQIDLWQVNYGKLAIGHFGMWQTNLSNWQINLLMISHFKVIEVIVKLLLTFP